MKLLITIFLLILSFACEAQNKTSAKGYFDVNVISGCYPLRVEITRAKRTVDECNDRNPCLISYENEKMSDVKENNERRHTYEKPGSYRVNVLFQSSGSNETDYIDISVKDNSPPELDVRPCSSNEIKLEVTSKAAYDFYKVDFLNDTQNAENIPVQPGDRHYASMRKTFDNRSVRQQSVEVRGLYNGAVENCPVASTTITLQEMNLPLIKTLHTELPNIITFNLEQPATVNYSIERSINGEDTFTNLMSNFQAAVFSTKGDIQKNFYCYRMRTQNPCTNTDIFSNIICTQKFSVETLPDKNKLNWTTSPVNVAHYQITEDSRDMEGDGKVEPPLNSFDDLTVVADKCKNTSTYQLITFYNNNSTSTSYKLEKVKPKIVQALSPVTNISASANGHSINLAWTLGSDPEANQLPAVFSIYKSAANYPSAILTTIKSSEAWTLVDDKYKPGIPTCYQIFYKDGCGNISPSTPTACIIQPTLTESQGRVTINWKEYTGFSTLTQYRLIKADESGKILAEENTGSATTYEETGIDNEHLTLLYYVIADPAADAGVPSAVSEVLYYNKTPTALFPTAFTPNGDAINDTFYAKGLFISKVAFYVYDRWGNMVYTTDDNEPWDGTRNGTVLPPSVYAWRAEVWDIKGRIKKYSGTVYMIIEKSQ